MAIPSKILIIDDDPVIRETIDAFLDNNHFKVIKAASGREGIEICRREKPDVILCDLFMPETSGLEVLKVVSREFPEMPLIIVSGTGSLDDAVNALTQGAWDYLTKPIANKKVLRHAIKQALERAELLRKNREYQEHLESTNRQLQQSLLRLREDEEAGRRLQFQLLPRDNQSFDNYQFSRKLWTSLYLSGDFVDYFYIDDDHLGFYIADVSGHGVSSAFVTVLLKSYMNRYLELFRQKKNKGILDPAKILARMNHNLIESDLDKYLTMFYGILYKPANQLYYSNGGQFPFPILFDGETARFIKCKSKPVGLFDFAEYQAETLNLPEKFVIAIFSDGILESLPQSKLIEKQQFLLSLVQNSEVSAQSLTQSLGLESTKTPPDDITLLLIKKN